MSDLTPRRARATRGRYRVVGRLGSGDLGIVLSARVPVRNRNVAVKLL
jgi:hypothetical protein